MGQEQVSPEKKIPAAKRESILWEASRQYMRGQISASRLREIECSTIPDSDSFLYLFPKVRHTDN
jgi:hypothetical protein